MKKPNKKDYTDWIATAILFVGILVSGLITIHRHQIDCVFFQQGKFYSEPIEVCIIGNDKIKTYTTQGAEDLQKFLNQQ